MRKYNLILILILLTSSVLAIIPAEATPTCNAGQNTSCYHLTLNNLVSGVIGAGDIENYITAPATVARSNSVFRIGVGIFAPAITSPVVTYTVGGLVGCTAGTPTTTSVSTTQSYQGWGDIAITMTGKECEGYVETKIVGGIVATTVEDMLLPFSVLSNEPNNHLCNYTDDRCTALNVVMRNCAGKSAADSTLNTTTQCATPVISQCDFSNGYQLDSGCAIPQHVMRQCAGTDEFGGLIEASYLCGVPGLAICSSQDGFTINSQCHTPNIWDHVCGITVVSIGLSKCTAPFFNETSVSATFPSDINFHMCSSRQGSCTPIYINGTTGITGTISTTITSWPTLLSKIISANETVCVVTSTGGCGTAVNLNEINSGVLAVTNSGTQHLIIDTWPSLTAAVTNSGTVNVVNSGSQSFSITSWPTLLQKIISGNQTICIVTSTGGCGSSVNLNEINSGSLAVTNSGGQALTITSWPQLQAVLSGDINTHLCSSRQSVCTPAYYNTTAQTVVTGTSHTIIDSWPNLVSSVTNSGTLNIQNPTGQTFALSGTVNTPVTGSLTVTNAGGQTISISSWPQLNAVLSGTITDNVHQDQACGATITCKSSVNSTTNIANANMTFSSKVSNSLQLTPYSLLLIAIAFFAVAAELRGDVLYWFIDIILSLYLLINRPDTSIIPRAVFLGWIFVGVYQTFALLMNKRGTNLSGPEDGAA